MTEDIELYVTANISSKVGHGSLHVSEKVELPGSDFRTISRALERFHGFGERLSAEILGDVVTAVDEVQELAGDVAAAAGPTDLDLAYLAYGRYVSTVPSSPCGHPLPMDFDRLPLTDRRAWAAAAAAVAAAVRP